MILEGKNAVKEAIENFDLKEHQIDKILIKKGYENGSLKALKYLAEKKNIRVQLVNKEKLDFMSETKNHQGIIAICPEKNYNQVRDILDKAKKLNEPPLIIILDEINDPRNFGAIIRNCECFGVHGIIMPKRRSVSLTGIVSKTSAGALEHVLIARVNNLAQEIENLKRNNIWILCADMQGEEIYNINFRLPSAIVIGSEGFGVRELIKKKSDFRVKIPMYGKINCLNASVAAGIFMYEARKRRVN